MIEKGNIIRTPFGVMLVTKVNERELPGGTSYDFEGYEIKSTKNAIGKCSFMTCNYEDIKVIDDSLTVKPHSPELTLKR